MSKYRFKTKEEFIRDGLWDEKYNCPNYWASDGQMNKYLGKDVPDEFNVHCNENEKFKYDGWLFQNTDYVLKEQQEYFPDLSQHIGRYIRALVDNPNSGSRVHKVDIGKIIDKDRVDFPDFKRYYCTEALRNDYLGIKYELLPEDYSPEQETKEPNIEFIPGKWYKVELSNKFNHYIKVDSVTEDEIILDCEGYVANLNKWDKGTSINLKTVTKYELLTYLSEIQKYLPDGHPDKVTKQKFEIGKWYKWYQKNHGNYHYGKVKEINIMTDMIVMTPWIIQCDDYKHSGTFDLSKAEQIQEISVEDIQEFLPEEHVDKFCETCNGEGVTMIGKLYPSGHTEVTDTCPDCNGTGFRQPNKFKKGEYIVITDKFDSWTKDFVSNHIYKQRKDSTYLQPEYDSLNSITNGWAKYTRNNTHNWRYATQEEIDEYERRGKPYDVTELQKKELSMKEIQEECKKRFPIGCTFIPIDSDVSRTLKKDSSTYYIYGNMIYAHGGGGCLYSDGKWAELVSLPEENITEIPEYIECTETQESHFIKGNIYKIIDSKNLDSARLVSNIELSHISAGVHLFCSMEKNDKKYWKPSTKEAYEQQKSLTYESVSGCFPTDKTMFIYDEVVRQYLSTAFDYWKEIPKFTEQNFDIYGPTPDIE